jgi:hypothetical protein
MVASGMFSFGGSPVFSGVFYPIGTGIITSQPLQIIKQTSEEVRAAKIELLHDLRNKCEKLERELMEDGVQLSDEFELYGRL